MHRSRSIWIALILSSGFHYWLSGLPNWLLISKPSWVNRSSEIEVELADGKRIVNSSRVEEEDLAKRSTPFGAEFKNRVSREMRSPLTGRFREGRGDPAGGGIEGLGSQRGEAKGPLGVRMGDLLGTSPDDLPKEIALGNQTILNTDPVLYASFINRIKDQLYDTWVDFVQEALELLSAREVKLEPNVYITKLMIHLDRDGKLTQIDTIQRSGVAEIDEAPSRAFWETEPFLNPPSQLFTKNGTVKFVYEFHFELKNSAFHIVPWI